MALGVRAAQLGKKKLLLTFLVLTLLLGLAFIGIKLGLEWRHDYLEGFAPGVNWTFHGPDSRHLELFFCFYFFLTGIHALHMVIGSGNPHRAYYHGGTREDFHRNATTRSRCQASTGTSWISSGSFSFPCCT